MNWIEIVLCVGDALGNHLLLPLEEEVTTEQLVKKSTSVKRSRRRTCRAASLDLGSLVSQVWWSKLVTLFGTVFASYVELNKSGFTQPAIVLFEIYYTFSYLFYLEVALSNMHGANDNVYQFWLYISVLYRSVRHCEFTKISSNNRNRNRLRQS